MSENLAAVIHGINDLRVEEVPMPEIADDEVLIRMSKVGICGTDVSYLTKGRIGNFVIEKPMIIGHEGAGVVERCGAAVKDLEPGDRVAIEPGVPCRYCQLCKSGHYNHCKEVVYCATPPFDGNLCQYYKHAADFCYKLPENVSLEEGATIQPLAIVVHACRRVGVYLGSEVLILGAGPIGLLAMLTAKAMGATKVCLTDIVDDRLSVAEGMGADFTLNVRSGTPEELAKKIEELMGRMPDITIECSGAEPSIRLAVFATKTGGVVGLVGLGKPDVSVPIVNAAVREVDIRGSFRFANSYPTSLNLVASGLVDIKQLITHRYKLEDAVEAFENARTGAGGAIKVIISCDDS